MWNDTKSILKIVLPIRLILFIYAYTSHKVTIPRWALDPTGLWHAFNSPFFDIWSRWDSAFYVDIATKGYTEKTIGMYPLYPFLIKIINFIIPHAHTSGLIISNLCYFIAMIIFFRYTKELFGKSVAQNTILAISIFPTSYIFSAVYSESTFLLVTILSCYFFHKEKYLEASLFGAMASATRNPGLILFPAFIIAFFIKTYKKTFKEKFKIFNFFIILLGFGAYLCIQYVYFDNPFLFLDVQKHWNRHLAWPSVALIRSIKIIFYGFSTEIHAEHIIRISEVIVSVVFLIITCFMIRKISLHLTLFSFLALLLPLSTSTTSSMVRFALTVFPVFMMLGIWMEKNEKLKYFIIILFSLFLGLFTTQFGGWYWLQ